MRKFLPLSGSVVRTSLFRLALIVAAGVPVFSQAQTVPQLLPYTSKLIAGGGTVAIAAGAVCPVSGYTSTDAYGDGCLATEIQLVSPRSAAADAAGDVFFSDYTNGLIRRVDAVTGIVAAVAGGASASPAAGVACGTFTSLDARGDGCLGTAVKLSHPVGLAFSPAGDLYFGDTGYAEVRKIAATAGSIPATGGVISLVAGNVATTFGFTANNASGNVIAATQSYLDAPTGVSFDASGNLYIAEEYKEALLVVNTNATTTTTVAGVSIPPGTIAKILGATTGSTPTVCPNSPATTNGCNYGLTVFGGQATSALVDGPYAVASDPAGNVYYSAEYYNYVGKITSAGVVSDYAGIQNSAAKKITRAAAGSFGIGSTFGLAADANSNVYVTDASNGVVWRIDGTGQSMYVVAGSGTPCSTATDAYGDGCPATKATFGSSGSGNYASTTAPGPGVYGVTIDAYSNLFVGDTETSLIREIASGTQFGPVGANQPTQTVAIHFATNDLPASGGAYTLTTGAANFSLGTAVCTTNSDATTDCLLPVTATPTTLGAFTGTLQVKASLGGVATFPLSGIYVTSPFTRTSVTATSTSTCSGSTVYATTATITLTATVVSTGTPTGTVTFFSNGTQIGTPQTISSTGVATLTLTSAFTTANTYKITATYSGDANFKTSTSGAPATFSTSAPTFAASAVTYQQSTVSQGQTGLYSFNVAQNVYAGTITMACSNLPANSSCLFSPTTVTGSGCSVTSVVALSILTSQPPASSSFGGSGRGAWSLLTMAAGFGLALLIGLRRRQTSIRFGQLWMMLALLAGISGLAGCGKGNFGGPATPVGVYNNITVTATGSTGLTSTFTVSLTVTAAH